MMITRSGGEAMCGMEATEFTREAAKLLSF
jgi:hypothetical protein